MAEARHKPPMQPWLAPVSNRLFGWTENGCEGTSPSAELRFQRSASPPSAAGRFPRRDTLPPRRPRPRPRPPATPPGRATPPSPRASRAEPSRAAPSRAARSSPGKARGRAGGRAPGARFLPAAVLRAGRASAPAFSPRILESVPSAFARAPFSFLFLLFPRASVSPA